MRDHQRARVIQVALQFRETFVEFRLRHEVFSENSIFHVLKKIAQNVALIVAWRVDMNNRVNLNVDETGGAEHLVRLPSHEQINPVVPRVCFENFRQSVPGRRRRIAEERSPVSLMAGDYASGPGQVDHLLNHALRFGYIDQNKAGVNHIKRSSWQTGCFGVCLPHLDIPQVIFGDELPS